VNKAKSKFSKVDGTPTSVAAAIVPQSPSN
jgi:hypothetical protein